MRILILGGAWSLGRLIATSAAHRGFEVTVFNRGPSTFGQEPRPATPAVNVRQIRGDRKQVDDLRALCRLGPWDAVVDIDGKVPAVVGRSARMLADISERYLSVSTILVYRDWPHQAVDETSPLLPADPKFDPGEWTFEPKLYGGMKAGCELACRQAFGDDRVIVLRLHEMIGQHEDDGPLLWWLNRMRRGGQVLVPGPDRQIQVIDVRDVADFALHLMASGRSGAFNVAAPPQQNTFGSLVQACQRAAAADRPAQTQLVWVDEDWLAEQGAQEWTEVPLWRRAAAPWNVNVDRAMAAGLACRPLSETAVSTLRWQTAYGKPDHPRFAAYGMPPAREEGFLRRWLSEGVTGQG